MVPSSTPVDSPPESAPVSTDVVAVVLLVVAVVVGALDVEVSVDEASVSDDGVEPQLSKARAAMRWIRSMVRGGKDATFA